MIQFTCASAMIQVLGCFREYELWLIEYAISSRAYFLLPTTIHDLITCSIIGWIQISVWHHSKNLNIEPKSKHGTLVKILEYQKHIKNNNSKIQVNYIKKKTTWFNLIVHRYNICYLTKCWFRLDNWRLKTRINPWKNFETHFWSRKNKLII